MNGGLTVTMIPGLHGDLKRHPDHAIQVPIVAINLSVRCLDYAPKGETNKSESFGSAFEQNGIESRRKDFQPRLFDFDFLAIFALPFCLWCSPYFSPPLQIIQITIIIMQLAKLLPTASFHISPMKSRAKEASELWT